MNSNITASIAIILLCLGLPGGFAQDEQEGPRPMEVILKQIKWFWPDGNVHITDANCRQYTQEFFDAYPFPKDQDISEELAGWYSRPYLVKAFNLREAGWSQDALEIVNWVLGTWPQTEDWQWYGALKLSLDNELGNEVEAAKAATELFDERVSAGALRIKMRSTYPLPELELWADIWEALAVAGDKARMDKMSEVIRQLVIANPAILSYLDFYELAVAVAALNGNHGEALVWATTGLRLCAYSKQGIARMVSLSQRAALAATDYDVNVADNLETYLRTGEGDDPIEFKRPPVVTQDELQEMLRNAGPNPSQKLPVYLYAELYDQALVAAKGLISMPGVSRDYAMAEIARCFKAKDGNLKRAEAFLLYVETKEGENPLPNF